MPVQLAPGTKPAAESAQGAAGEADTGGAGAAVVPTAAAPRGALKKVGVSPATRLPSPAKGYRQPRVVLLLICCRVESRSDVHTRLTGACPFHAILDPVSPYSCAESIAWMLQGPPTCAERP